MYTFMEYNSVCTDTYFNIERKQLQRQSEHHQAQQEAAHIQHRAHLKSPHRLNVRVQHQGQAHQRRASRHLPHQSAIHSLILRQRQSRQHQRLQQQRQARLQRVLNQKLRQQKRTQRQRLQQPRRQQRQNQLPPQAIKTVTHSLILHRRQKQL